MVNSDGGDLTLKELLEFLGKKVYEEQRIIKAMKVIPNCDRAKAEERMRVEEEARLRGKVI